MATTAGPEAAGGIEADRGNPGASEPAFGYSRVRVEDVDVWWRQRLVVPGREPVVTTSIRPRRVVVGHIGRALSAVADYA